MKTEEIVERLGALAHEGRLEIFRLLVRRTPDEVSAGEIAEALGVRATTLSNQLSALESARLLRSRRDGRSVRYRVDLDEAGRLLGALASDCCRGRPDVCAPAAAFLTARGEAAARREGEMGERAMNVLFLCTGNSARSIFAEAILRRFQPEKFNAFSAGSSPRGDLAPETVDLLTGLGYDVSTLRSKSWDEFAGDDAPALDFVFTVCDQAANETCPVWPGQPMSAHWGTIDPAAAEGGEAERRLAFAEAYRTLYNRIKGFSSLPIEALDALSLQRKLDEIGRMAPPAGALLE